MRGRTLLLALVVMATGACGVVGALRDWLLALPPADPGCPLAVEPRFEAEVWVEPPPDVAEFADLSNHEVGGPCQDLDRAQLEEFVALWNAAGGSLELRGPDASG